MRAANPIRCAVFTAVLLFGAGAPLLAVAQILPLPPSTDRTQTLSEETVRRRVEALLRGGRRQDAAAILEERAANQELERSLKRRLARIYRDLERYEDLEALLLPELNRSEDAVDLGSLRMLAEARYALDRPDEAREVLDRLVAEGWMSEAEARDPERLSDVVSDLVDCWGRRMAVPDATALHKAT